MEVLSLEMHAQVKPPDFLVTGSSPSFNPSDHCCPDGLVSPPSLLELIERYKRGTIGLTSKNGLKNENHQ